MLKNRDRLLRFLDSFAYCESFDRKAVSLIFPCIGYRAMPWLLLILAGLFEIGFTTCLKLSENFTNLRWTLGFLVTSVISFYLLTKATETIPMGTGYAIWTGIGAAGTVIVGMLLFDEPTDTWRLFFLVLLIGSIAGLKLVSPH